jgi:enhancing lycopene biosynthesis protein 2
VERRIFAAMVMRNLFPKPYRLKTISGFASRDEEQQIRKEILIKLTNAMHRRQKPVTVVRTIHSVPGVRSARRFT